VVRVEHPRVAGRAGRPGEALEVVPGEALEVVLGVAPGERRGYQREPAVRQFYPLGLVVRLGYLRGRVGRRVVAGLGHVAAGVGRVAVGVVGGVGVAAEAAEAAEAPGVVAPGVAAPGAEAHGAAPAAAGLVGPPSLKSPTPNHPSQ
jgi:hypothetical protein